MRMQAQEAAPEYDPNEEFSVDLNTLSVSPAGQEEFEVDLDTLQVSPVSAPSGPDQPWTSTSYGFRVRPSYTHSGRGTVEREDDAAVWYGHEHGAAEPGWYEVTAQNKRGKRLPDVPEGYGLWAGLKRGLTTAPTLEDAKRTFYQKGVDPEKAGIVDTVLSPIAGLVNGIAKGMITPFQAGAQLVYNAAGYGQQFVGEALKLAAEGAGNDSKIGELLGDAGKFHAKTGKAFRDGINAAVKQQNEFLNSALPSSEFGDVAGMVVGPTGALTERAMEKTMFRGGPTLEGLPNRMLPQAPKFGMAEETRQLRPFMERHPGSKTVLSGAAGGGAAEALTPTELAPGEDYATEKGKRLLAAGGVGAGVPAAAIGVSRMANAATNTLMNKRGGLFSEMRNFVKQHPDSGKRVQDAFRNRMVEMKAAKDYWFDQARLEEGKIPVSKDGLISDLEALKRNIIKEGKSGPVINYIDEEIERVRRMETNVENVYSVAKELRKGIDAMIDDARFGKGGEVFPTLDTRLRVNQIFDDAYLKVLPDTIDRVKIQEIVNNMNNIYNDLKRDPSHTYLSIAMQDLPKVSYREAKYLWSKTYGEIKGGEESSRFLRDLLKTENPEAVMNKIISSEKNLATQVYDKMVEPERQMIRMAMLEDLDQKIKNKGFNAARDYFRSHRPVYDTFFKDELNKNVQAIESLMKLTPAVGYTGSAGLSALLSAVGFYHFGGVVGTTSSIVGLPTIMRFTPKRAVFRAMSSAPVQNFLNSIAGRDQNYVKEKVVEAIREFKRWFERYQSENPQQAERQRKFFNSKMSGWFKFAKEEPLVPEYLKRPSIGLMPDLPSASLQRGAPLPVDLDTWKPGLNQPIWEAPGGVKSPISMPMTTAYPENIAPPPAMPSLGMRSIPGAEAQRGAPLPIDLDTWKPGLNQPVFGPGEIPNTQNPSSLPVSIQGPRPPFSAPEGELPVMPPGSEFEAPAARSVSPLEFPAPEVRQATPEELVRLYPKEGYRYAVQKPGSAKKVSSAGKGRQDQLRSGKGVGKGDKGKATGKAGSKKAKEVKEPSPRQEQLRRRR